ncbi:MAG TPA: ROK family protein [Syntrophomonadaceae bacterium]|nr:ROK family protein [Syntrophomonadaceae bacterium]
MKEYAIGIDLGGTKILTALVDRQGRIYERILLSTPIEQGAEYIMDIMAESVEELQHRYCCSPGQIKGVGVACPGPLDYVHGVVYGSPNLQWDDVHICAGMQSRLDFPVYIDKDTNMAAQGELSFGQAGDCKNFVYITVSTGIGGSLVLNGEVFHGYFGGAGEIGHMVADPHGPLCRCGQRGCLEAMASGTAIARKAQALIVQGRGQGIAVCAKGKITAREVGMAARQGDIEAADILDDTLEVLASSLSSLIHLLHPQRIILGGGVALGLADLWLPALQERVYQQVFPMHRRGLCIEMTGLGNDIGVLGAAAYVFEQLCSGGMYR